MLYRYENLTVNKSYQSQPEDKTHILTFRQIGATSGAAGPGLFATGQISQPLTEQEASAYTLGFEYTLQLSEFPAPTQPST